MMKSVFRAFIGAQLAFIGVQGGIEFNLKY